jgi:hypothetical protein
MKIINILLKFNLIFLIIIALIFLIVAVNPPFSLLITTTNVSTNDTNVNLSILITNLDATGLANITNWYEDNKSLLVLNMPFATNTTDVKDYSEYNNNGTITGALWQRYLNEDNNSLVLMLPFDEDTSSTVIDASDYGNNGILTGSILSSNCVTGKCYSFDGVNDYINISSAQFKELHPKRAFTIEAWVNTGGRSGNQYQGIVDTSRSGYSGFMLRLGEGDTKVRFDFANSTPGGSFSQAGNTNLNNNTWYHIVNTWDGTNTANGVKYYINGILDKQATASQVTGEINSSRDLIIGAELSLGNVFFNGSIDNVRIYNKALTASEIQDHYQKYKLYYQPSFKFGKSGTLDYINISGGTRPSNFVDNFAVEFWFNSGNGNPEQSIFCSACHLTGGGGGYIGQSFGIIWQNNRIYGKKSGWDSPLTSSILNNNQWYHVVASISNTTTGSKLYIDGKVNATNASIINFASANSANMMIGQIGGIKYNGSISNVRIWNRSLSANEILSLYNEYNTTGIQKLVSEETTAGKTYKVSAYVANSSNLGNNLNTTELLIREDYLFFINSPLINSTNGLNTTEQNLNIYFTPNNTKSSNINYSIEVYKNNASQFLLSNIPTAINTFTSFNINNLNTTKGETWKAVVWITDSVINSSLMNTGELLILNSAPQLINNVEDYQFYITYFYNKTFDFIFLDLDNDDLNFTFNNLTGLIGQISINNMTNLSTFNSTKTGTFKMNFTAIDTNLAITHSNNFNVTYVNAPANTGNMPTIITKDKVINQSNEKKLKVLNGFNDILDGFFGLSFEVPPFVLEPYLSLFDYFLETDVINDKHVVNGIKVWWPLIASLIFGTYYYNRKVRKAKKLK